MGGGGASGSSGVPSNTSGTAVAYQPTAQPQADQFFQQLLGGFAGSLSPLSAYNFGQEFPGINTNVPYLFDTTPGGVGYSQAQPFVGGAGSGTITDPNNPNYLQALYGASNLANVAPYLQVSGQNLAGFGGGLSGNFLDTAFGQALSTAQGVAPQLGSLGSSLASSASTIAPQQLSNALTNQTNLNSLGYNQLLPGIFNAYNFGQASLGPASDIINGIWSAAPQAMSGATAGSNALNQYGNQILQTAFDPQGALYNQLQNQVAQQSEAAAAAAGLGGSAYGASTVGNNLGNFNINWQNQQLARQAEGLGAAEPAFTTAGALPGSTASSLAGGLGATTAAALSPVQTESGLMSNLGSILQGAGALPGNTLSQYGSLGNTIAQLGSAATGLNYAPYAGAATTGSDIASLIGAGNTLSQGGALDFAAPLATQSGYASNALSGIGNLVNIGNQQFTIPQQFANDLQSYLQLGQAASGLSGQLGALGLNEQQSSLAGIGSALGTGSNLLFGTQGLSGALGLGSGGLIGGLGGGGGLLANAPGVVSTLGPAAGDLTLAGGGDFAAGAGAAAGGGGSFLSSLLPFGAS